MKKITWGVILILAASLTALLAYSLNRSAWAFAVFEQDAALGWWAALTIEVGLVGFIIARAVADILPLEQEAKEGILSWSGRGMLTVLCLNVVINLSAGYLRGGRIMLDDLGGSESSAAYNVAAVLWFVVNAIIPCLIYWLSEMLARVVRSLFVSIDIETYQTVQTAAPVMSILSSPDHLLSADDETLLDTMLSEQTESQPVQTTRPDMSEREAIDRAVALYLSGDADSKAAAARQMGLVSPSQIQSVVRAIGKAKAVSR